MTASGISVASPRPSGTRSPRQPNGLNPAAQIDHSSPRCPTPWQSDSGFHASRPEETVPPKQKTVPPKQKTVPPKCRRPENRPTQKVTASDAPSHSGRTAEEVRNRSARLPIAPWDPTKRNIPDSSHLPTQRRIDRRMGPPPPSRGTASLFSRRSSLHERAQSDTSEQVSSAEHV